MQHAVCLCQCLADARMWLIQAALDAAPPASVLRTDAQLGESAVAEEYGAAARLHVPDEVRWNSDTNFWTQFQQGSALTSCVTAPICTPDDHLFLPSTTYSS